MGGEGHKITENGDCSHESYDKPRQYIKKPRHHFADQVKAMVFPVVIYRCESWTINKGERLRNDAFKLLEKTLESPLDSKEIKPVNSILKDINPEYSLKRLRLKLKLQ